MSDIDKHCLAEFRKHWECLDNNNQQLWQCRRYERSLNKCVFDNLVSSFLSRPSTKDVASAHLILTCASPWQKLEKIVPGTPEGEIPIHERKRNTYAHHKSLA